jgi:SAM-dependent methyltransferase
LMDLGCGTGEFLFFLKKNYFPGRLYGMDISESAIAKGKESGFEREKTELFTGDIFDLYNSVSKINLNSVEIFSFMFVLHEFDDGQVKTILKTIKDHYPKSKILLTELINKSSQETRKHNRTVFPELKFVHQLSKQILRTPTEWKELFSEADFRATIEVTSKLTNQVCLLFTQG